jgi:hypothetical protein
MKNNIKVGDLVELTIDELLDDHYQDSKRTVVKKGTIMEVIAIAPKVFMSKDLNNDKHHYFLNLVMPNSLVKERVRTNFCNVKKI